MLTLIVSDLHLGAPNSQTNLFLSFLSVISPFDLLIINGDLIDSLDLRRFGENDWEVVRRLQELARAHKLSLILGNHDYLSQRLGSLVVVPSLLNIEGCLSKNLLVGDKEYLIIHGDSFDRTTDWYKTGQVADWVYYWIQRLGTSGVWLKHTVKRLAGVATKVPIGAVQRALSDGYDGIVCGHTHFSANEYINGVHYLNSGCWTEPVCSYIEIKDDKINLCHWPR